MSRAYLRGPLTTTWTQPSWCNTPIGVPEIWVPTGTMGLICKVNPVSTTWETQGPVALDVYLTTADPSCFPSAAGSEDMTGFFSPGLVCPQGYTAACHSTGGSSGNFEFEFPVLANETAIGCCPSKFDCLNGITTRQCTYIATSTTFIQQICDQDGPIISTVVLPSVLVDGMGYAAGSVTAALLIAPIFQLNWQSSDLPVTTNSATTITQTISVMNTGLISPTATPIATPTTTPNGLSTGAKAGIGVGAAIGTLTVIGLLAWFILRHRRTKLPAYQDSFNRASELQGQPRHEITGENIDKLKASPQQLPELYQDSGVDQTQRHEMGMD